MIELLWVLVIKMMMMMTMMQVIELLGQGKKYYDSVYGEAEIVATAYHNFGNRVNKVSSVITDNSVFTSTSTTSI